MDGLRGFAEEYEDEKWCRLFCGYKFYDSLCSQRKLFRSSKCLYRIRVIQKRFASFNQLDFLEIYGTTLIHFLFICRKTNTVILNDIYLLYKTKFNNDNCTENISLGTPKRGKHIWLIGNWGPKANHFETSTVKLMAPSGTMPNTG